MFERYQDRLRLTSWFPDNERVAIVVDDHVEIWHTPERPLGLDTPLDARPPQGWLPERIAATRKLLPGELCEQRLIVSGDGGVVVCRGNTVSTAFSADDGSELWQRKSPHSIAAVGRSRVVELTRDRLWLIVLDAFTGRPGYRHPLASPSGLLETCGRRIVVADSDGHTVLELNTDGLDLLTFIASPGADWVVWDSTCTRFTVGGSGRYGEVWRVDETAPQAPLSSLSRRPFDFLSVQHRNKSPDLRRAFFWESGFALHFSNAAGDRCEDAHRYAIGVASDSTSALPSSVTDAQGCLLPPEPGWAVRLFPEFAWESLELAEVISRAIHRALRVRLSRSNAGTPPAEAAIDISGDELRILDTSETDPQVIATMPLSDDDTPRTISRAERTDSGDWILVDAAGGPVVCEFPTLEHCVSLSIPEQVPTHIEIRSADRISVLHEDGVRIHDFGVSPPAVRHVARAVSAWVTFAGVRVRPSKLQIVTGGGVDSYVELGRDGLQRVVPLGRGELEYDHDVQFRWLPGGESVAAVEPVRSSVFYYDLERGSRVDPALENATWWSPVGTSFSARLLAYRHHQKPNHFRVWDVANAERVADVQLTPGLRFHWLEVSENAHWLAADSPAGVAVIMNVESGELIEGTPGGRLLGFASGGRLLKETGFVDLRSDPATLENVWPPMDWRDRHGRTLSRYGSVFSTQTRTELVVPSVYWSTTAPSPDGSLFIAALPEGVAVYETATGGLVAEVAMTLDGRYNAWMSHRWSRSGVAP